MTRDEGLINSITEWLEDQPERAPDQLLDSVLTDLRTAPQRAHWRVALRRFPMLGPGLGRYGALAGVAVMVVVVAVGLWAVRGSPVVGPGDSPAPTPTSVAIQTIAPAPTSAVTPPTATVPATAAPSPVMLRGQGPLAPGVYFHEANASCRETSGVRITLELPAGWANGVACQVSKSRVEGTGGPVRLSYHQSPIVYVDPCRPEAGVKPTETVDDIATALADVPAEVSLVTSPTDTTIGGFRGKHLAWTFDAIDPDERRDFIGCGFSPWRFASFTSRFEPGKQQDVWILDVAGTQLVINAEYYHGGIGTFNPETPDADRAELQAVIDSIEIEALDE